MYCPKIAHGAYLATAKGSDPQRNEQSFQMGVSFATDLFKALLQGKEISGDVFLRKIKKQSSGMNLKIRPLDKNKVRPEVVAQLGTNFNKSEQVSGFTFLMPMTNSDRNRHLLILTLQDFGTCVHEALHLFKTATSPKYSARKNLEKFSKDKNIHETPLDPHNFYQDEILLQGLSASKNSTEGTNKIKAKISKYFQIIPLSSNEKIDILQCWRHKINEEKFCNEGELKILNIFMPDECAKERIYVNELFLNEKANLLTEILKKEISEHRKEHSKRIKDI